MKKIWNIFKRKQKGNANYEVYDIQDRAKNGMIISEDKLIVFSDGDCVKLNNYSISPEENVNNIPLYNYYGQKIYNKLMND